jgi:hypothetical protein
MNTGGSRGHDVGGSDPGFGRQANRLAAPKNPLGRRGASGVAPAHVVKIIRAKARPQE